MRNQSAELLIEYLLRQSLRYFRGVTSVIVHGSAARREYSVYSDQEQDILLGNVGLMIITDSPMVDRLIYPSFLRFLRHIDRSDFSKMIEKPLILVKPFEISLVPRSHLTEGRIAPDIWAFEMVKANRVIYGENLLPLFKTEFGLDAGLKMTISRLFGLNLSLPLILRADVDSRLNRLVVNYESTKGILGAFEALLTLLGSYQPSYSERANLVTQVIGAFSRDLENPEEATTLFEQASRCKLNPQELESLPPIELWFKARNLLFACLKIYYSQGYTMDSYWNKPKSHSRIRAFLGFAIHGKFEPRTLLMSNLAKTSTTLMLKHLLSIKPEDCQKPSK
ncbi:MAG: hypothetical protein DRI01_08850, partial [Chloroflexi bacterium]